MRRSLILTGLTAVLMLVVGAAAQAQLPFGVFEGLAGGRTGGGGTLAVTGWALDDDGIQAVDIFVDGILVGRAAFGLPRPGVEAQFPGFPDSAGPGFGFHLDTTRFLNGDHLATARVTSTTGEIRFLNVRRIQFTNSTHLLVPFGRIEFPPRGADLFGTCDLQDPDRRVNVVSGFALDAGVEIGDLGVGWVELLIDGAIFANTRRDCFFDASLGGLSNCYGLQRLDIERKFPHLKDAPTSGYRFVVDVGALIELGYVPGVHVLTVRVGDISGQVADIDEIPVTFLCDDFVNNEGSFGDIGIPHGSRIFSGIIEASGWALDAEGVATIDVFVDGRSVGEATHGIARPDIMSLFPGFPDSAGPGWSITIDTTTLSDGMHQMEVRVRDVEDELSVLGEVDFIVNNPELSFAVPGSAERRPGKAGDETRPRRP